MMLLPWRAGALCPSSPMDPGAGMSRRTHVVHVPVDGSTAELLVETFSSDAGGDQHQQ